MAGFNYEALREEVSDFAAREIAPREELSRRLDFPADLWSSMGDAGLMSIALPSEFGGRAGDYRAIALTLETLADVGGCQGVAISWMSQALNARMHILGLVWQRVGIRSAWPSRNRELERIRKNSQPAP